MAEIEKKKRRFNVVDVIIIILVLAALAAAIYVFFGSKLTSGGASGEKKKISFVLQSTELRDFYVDSVKKDDDVYEDETDKYLGKVTAVSSTVATRIGTDLATGAQVVSEIEGRINLFVTIEGEAEFYDGQYLVDGIPIVVGNVVTMVTPNLLAPTNIVSVEILE